MAFDGIPRPAQFTPPVDALNPYLGANAARAKEAGKPKVQSLGHEEKIKGVLKEQQENHAGDEDAEREQESFNEEEAEQIRLFAKMRGILNFSLEKGVNYQFQINPTTGLIELLNMDAGTIALILTHDELMQLSEKIHRYAGILTDRSG